MKKTQVYLDMDEVIYPLSEVVIYRHNEDFNENYDWKKNNSYWWEDTGKPHSYFEKILNEEGTFFRGEPNPEDVAIIKKLHDEGFEINVITAPMWNDKCVNEKIKWLRKYFSFINVDKHLHFTAQKWKMAKGNRVLLDDNDDHLVPWSQHGGVSVAYKNYSWGTKTERRVNNFEEFYKFIHEFEKTVK